MSQANFTAEGGCACGSIRYRMTSAPLFVHCCHCRNCQRQTGAAFALNAIIESDRVEVLSGTPIATAVSSPSGKGQEIMRCPACKTALWSHYGAAGEKVVFVRAGTLDEPEQAPPDVHIFTVSKQPWVILPDDIPHYDGFYDWPTPWPAESQKRLAALRY